MPRMSGSSRSRNQVADLGWVNRGLPPLWGGDRIGGKDEIFISYLSDSSEDSDEPIPGGGGEQGRLPEIDTPASGLAGTPRSRLSGSEIMGEGGVAGEDGATRSEVSSMEGSV